MRRVEFYVVGEGRGYTAIDSQGNKILGHHHTQRAAFKAVDRYVQFRDEIAEAARCMDGMCL